MNRFRPHLPPLDALVLFEAAARLENFSAAARELNISQSAVSQQVKLLEDRVRVDLFARDGRRVKLTHLGKEYQTVVTRALGMVADATRELRSTRGRKRITLAADQSIAWMWLMKRMPVIQKHHPAVPIRLIASDSLADCLSPQVTMGILHGSGDWPGYDSRLLFPEEVFPVCSPDYLRNAGPLRNAADLQNHNLLHLEDDQWQWMNWRVWMTENGLTDPNSQHGLVINNYPLLIEAAKSGQGVALGWRNLIDEALVSGELLRPVPGTVRTEAGYHIVWSQERPLPEEAVQLAGWLAAEAAAERALAATHDTGRTNAHPVEED
ncbi:LysR substrate-binding domain-containing protein [Leisingera thetidis]|uniref:LysR substrate-binding domain-containing protein n=1 Tax=Leisingera thetidis TaxID=2930199 RepID=UPI0021F7BADD|nr:LysR substrate-binding domain-containing protein [Leisingera thetidis]